MNIKISLLRRVETLKSTVTVTTMQHRATCLKLLLMTMVAVGATDKKALRIYDSLNKTEKLDFLKYHLAVGYVVLEDDSPLRFHFPKDLDIPVGFLRKLQHYNLPVSFSSQFFKKMQSKYALSATQMLQLILGQQICLPDGRCVDTGDSGAVCCSFGP